MTTHEAAEYLQLTPRRIIALIASGRLKATKVGRDWRITRTVLEKFAHGKPGRPRKGRK